MNNESKMYKNSEKGEKDSKKIEKRKDIWKWKQIKQKKREKGDKGIKIVKSRTKGENK